MKNLSMPSLPIISTGFALVLALNPLAAQAIKGTYLPDSALPKNVCRIIVGQIKTTYTPTYGNNVSNGWPVLVDVTPMEQSICSASLISPNAILTAAHCFQGNNEQAIHRGKFFYPKQNKDGVREIGCEGPEWYLKPECKIKIKGSVTEKWENVRVECPTLDGKTQSRPLEMNMGFPNPLFSTDSLIPSQSSANYDVTVWKFREPLLNSAVATPEFDIESMLEATKLNWQSCRSFGYGRDNEDKSGILRGAVTPIVNLAPMMLAADDRAPIKPTALGVGRTDHGDSGGALVCSSLDGSDKLFGVVSRGTIVSGRDVMGFQSLQQSSPADAPGAEHRSWYASTAYNAPWIQRVLNQGPLERDGSREQWYLFVKSYVRGEFDRNLDTAMSCVQENRDRMSRSAYKNVYLFGYKTLLSRVQELENNYAVDQNAGMYISKVQELLGFAKQMGFNCQAGQAFDN